MKKHAPDRTPNPGLPPTPPEGELTRILADGRRSRSVATNEILPLVYTELRRLAAARLSREARGHTLQPTALVHEAYLRLLGPPSRSGNARKTSGDRSGDAIESGSSMGAGEEPTWENRRHFFGAAAEAMRRILIDHARTRSRQKRRVPAAMAGQGEPQIDDPATQFQDLIALDAALTKLAEADPQKAQLVELKFFAGLPTNEVAEVLGVSLRTAERQWAFARAWLYREIEGSDETDANEANTDGRSAR